MIRWVDKELREAALSSLARRPNYRTKTAAGESEDRMILFKHLMRCLKKTTSTREAIGKGSDSGQQPPRYSEMAAFEVCNSKYAAATTR
jgi:hypothetical protein